MTKNIIKMFKDDGIVPDLDQLKQYVKLFASDTNYQFMMELFE